MNINNVVKNGYINNPAAVNNYKDVAPVHAAKSGIKLSEEKTDTVSISSAADSFRAVNETAKSISEELKGSVSANRVDEIKSMIKNGTYDVSSNAVADSILAHMMF